jgi:hypothetical protein
VHDLESTAGIAALAAGAVAIVAIAISVWLAVRLARVRSDQIAVLGERRRDLVAHAAELQAQFEALDAYVAEVAARLDGRMADAERRLDGAISHSALVRYDAYGEMSGRQSISLALLDSRRTGVVLSAIHHRDQARLYAKRLRDGRPELELSPEEDEAVRTAMDDGGPAQSTR